MRQLSLGAPLNATDITWCVQSLRQVEEASYIAELLPEIIPDDHTFTGHVTFAPSAGTTAAVTITPPPDAPALAITQTGAGDNGGALTGQSGFGFSYSEAVITDSRADYGTSPFTYGAHIVMFTGGATTRGSKIAFGAHAIRSAAEQSAVAYGDLIGGVFTGQSNVNDGGTNTGAGARGTVFGCNPGATLGNGATNYFFVSGAEVDVGIQTGASSQNRTGWQVVGTGNLPGASIDAAYTIGADGETDSRWKDGILFTAIHGQFPILPAGNCLRAEAGTFTNAIDFSACTVTGNFLKGPSSSFLVDGSGNTSGLKLTLTGNATPQIIFTPTTGATKNGQIYQTANSLRIADAGVADRITIALATGDITCGSVTGGIFSGASIVTTFQIVSNTASVTLANGLNSNISNGGGGRIRVTGPTAGFSIGGFSFAVGGLCLRVYNTTAQQMTIVNEDASSTAAFRIKTLTGADVVLRAGTSYATFIYDGTDARWILESTN